MEYKTVYKEESYGGFSFGIKIQIASDQMPDLKQNLIRDAIYKSADNIKTEVCAAIKQNDPKTPDRTKENFKLTNLFQAPVFIEEIPNGYCNDWCCRHLPWFVVTTSIGRFTIGWRKRVINIDWSETLNTGYSYELFADEDVTKGTKSIHAWNIEKAIEYIDTIFQSSRE